MTHLLPYLVTAVVLQIAMVVTGHFHEGVRNLSAILGVGIPFLIGCWYGVAGAETLKWAAGGGFLVGLLGAVIGILLAIVIGDQEWILLTFGPPSSGVTGMLGALIVYAIAAKL